MAKSPEEIEAEREQAKAQLEEIIKTSRPKNVQQGMTAGVGNILKGAVGGAGVAVLIPTVSLVVRFPKIMIIEKTNVGILNYRWVLLWELGKAVSSVVPSVLRKLKIGFLVCLTLRILPNNIVCNSGGAVIGVLGGAALIVGGTLIIIDWKLC